MYLNIVHNFEIIYLDLGWRGFLVLTGTTLDTLDTLGTSLDILGTSCVLDTSLDKLGTSLDKLGTSLDTLGTSLDTSDTLDTSGVLDISLDTSLDTFLRRVFPCLSGVLFAGELQISF